MLSIGEEVVVDDFPRVSYGGSDDEVAESDEDDEDDDDDLAYYVGSEKTYISPLYSSSTPKYASGDF